MMRDHPRQCLPILAGLFGVKLNQGINRLRLKKIAESMFSKSLTMTMNGTNDQLLLQVRAKIKIFYIIKTDFNFRIFFGLQWTNMLWYTIHTVVESFVQVLDHSLPKEIRWNRLSDPNCKFWFSKEKNNYILLHIPVSLERNVLKNSENVHMPVDQRITQIGNFVDNT